MSARRYLYMSAGAWGGQGVADGCELSGVGTESSRRGAIALNTEPSLQPLRFIFLLSSIFDLADFEETTPPVSWSC